MAKTVVIPLADYPTGTTNLPQRSIPDGLLQMNFEFQRCTTPTPTIWPNASTTLQMSFEGSLDGGANWTPAGGFGSSGGIHTKLDGTEATVSSFSVPLPAGTNRLMRGSFTVTNGPLRTQGSIEFL